MFFANPFKSRLPEPSEALPGREAPLLVADTHAVHGRPIKAPFPEGLEEIQLGLGCFWGAERLFWQLEGVYSTAVGYAGGLTENPTYEEVCSGRTAHAEMVLVVFDPAKIPLAELLAHFWQEHDPTQGNRQGNDVGTQYRSAIYAGHLDQLETIHATAKAYNAALQQAGMGPITTEITGPQTFYYAETYHQQYLHKQPNGYCGLKGTGVACVMV